MVANTSESYADTQTIIDLISMNLCTKTHQSIVVFGDTVREAEAFVEALATRIPNYVGLQRVRLGRFITSGRTHVRCIASTKSACGVGINALYILNTVKSDERARINLILYPVIKPVWEKSKDATGN